jgi:hypothetical protein
MFIPAGELADPAKYEHMDVKYARNATFGQVKQHKLKEAATGAVYNARSRARVSEPTLYESIKAEGVQEPVHVYPAPPASTSGYSRKDTLGQGHHRVFAAANIHPDSLVPVIWRPGGGEDAGDMTHFGKFQ